MTRWDRDARPVPHPPEYRGKGTRKSWTTCTTGRLSRLNIARRHKKSEQVENIRSRVARTMRRHRSEDGVLPRPGFPSLDPLGGQCVLTHSVKNSVKVK